MQSNQTKKNNTQNNNQRLKQRRSKNQQVNRSNNANVGSCRIHRKELWFEISNTGTGRYVFQDGNYPLWFEKLSKVFESYRMHSVTIHWISGYSQFAGGSIFMSYNVNKANKNTPFSVSSIFAQQSSGKSRLCENSSFKIPSSSWNQTPTRRSCQGIDDSYLFDLRYAIQTNETPQPISVWIEYDVTFHTPQIETYTTAPTIGNQFAVLKYGDSENVGKPQGLLLGNNKYYWSVEGDFTKLYIGLSNLLSTTLDNLYQGTSNVIAKYTITHKDGTVRSYTFGYNHGSSTTTSADNYLYYKVDDESSPTGWKYWNGTTGHLSNVSWNSTTHDYKPIAGNSTDDGNAIQLSDPQGFTKVEVDYDPVLAKQPRNSQ